MHEFAEMMTERTNSRDTREEIIKVFACSTQRAQGKITFRNLMRVA